MTKLKSFIRSHLSRVVGGVAAGGAAWVGVPESMVGEAETAVVTALTLVVYGVVHRLLDAVGVNPEDAANPK